jgi:hypothetical protein
MAATVGRLAGRVRIYAGVIGQARDRQRRRRAVAVAVSAAAAAAAVAMIVGGGGSTPGRGPVVPRSADSVVRDLTRGHAEATFSLREPAGVVLLARISAPRGVRAFVNATIPGVAGVQMGTTPDRFGQNPTCAVHGQMNVCTEAVQWCPMPQATWRFRVAKVAGPAGAVRVDFIVGPAPHSRAAVAQ